jgi:quercetin dioxygenase-like cupin family protein
METTGDLFPEYTPEAEIVEPHPLYLKILHPVRRTKPGRVLFTSWPMGKESRAVVEPVFSYTVYIEPNQLAGNHFHKKKAEILVLLGKGEIHLEDPETKEADVITVENDPRTKDVIELIAIRKGVAHTVKNTSEEEALQLLVLANTSEMGPDDFEYKVI